MKYKRPSYNNIHDNIYCKIILITIMRVLFIIHSYNYINDVSANYFTHAIIILDETSTRFRFRMQRSLRRFPLYVSAFYMPIIRPILI